MHTNHPAETGKNASRSLILGSSSAYRRALLERLALPFSCISPGIDETPLPQEHPAATARRLAREKAKAVASLLPADQKNSLIIGSDQVAVVGDQVYGKPGNHEKAVAQLQALSGQTVRFETALCLYDAVNGQTQEELIGTEVEFQELSLAEIEAYLQREPAYDCAGSAKSEALGIALLDRLSGDDPTALVGLPLIALCRMLRHAGFNPLLV
ncbi:MAG: Maf/YceF/YhdE family protein [Fluviibacter phosphoraccumulans EoVTN8]